MSDERVYEVELEGQTPILMHRFSIDEMKSKPRVVRGNDQKNYEGEWIKHVYLAVDEQTIALPWALLMASLRDGATGIKQGKLGAKKLLMGGSTIQEFETPVYVNGDPLTLEQMIDGDMVHRTGVVVNRARVVRERGMIPCDAENGWSISFTLRVTNPQLLEETIEAVLENAGRAAGFGDWRPGAPKPGPFGKYTLKKFRQVAA